MRKLLCAASVIALASGLLPLGATSQGAPRSHPPVAWQEGFAGNDYPRRFHLVPNCYESFGPGLLGCRPQIVVPETPDVTVASRSVTMRVRHPYPALYTRPFGPDAQ